MNQRAHQAFQGQFCYCCFLMLGQCRFIQGSPSFHRLEPGTAAAAAAAAHSVELCCLSFSINKESPRYTEEEVSANEIFKHLKSLKTNLPNVSLFSIKSSVCNYIGQVVSCCFHDLLPAVCPSARVNLLFICAYYCKICVRAVNYCVCVCVDFIGQCSECLTCISVVCWKTIFPSILKNEMSLSPPT